MCRESDTSQAHCYDWRDTAEGDPYGNKPAAVARKLSAVKAAAKKATKTVIVTGRILVFTDEDRHCQN